MVRIWVCLVAFCIACGDSTVSAGRSPAPRQDGGPTPAPRDDDGDGLCNETELELGTNPGDPDTDQDAIPDAIEVANGLDALSNLSPGPAQLVILRAEPAQGIATEIRLTVEGAGETFSGHFLDFDAAFAGEPTAGSFLESQLALAAVPPDNIQSLDTEQRAYLGVQGSTRLRFEVHFRYPDEETARACATVHPFQYLVAKQDEAEQLSPMHYLVLSPSGTMPTADGFCSVDRCF